MHKPLEPTLVTSKHNFLLLIPLALAIGFGLSLLEGSLGVFIWVIGMPVHELGHASIYWLSGILALPAPWMTVPLHENFSFLSFLFFSVALYFLFLYGRRNKSLFLISFSILLGILLFIFSFLVSKEKSQMITIYAGLGGEMYLSLLMIIFSTINLPKIRTWPRKQILLLFWGAVVFTSSTLSWAKISRGYKALPKGALVDPAAWFGEESNGDLDRLARNFGWSDEFIIRTYINTAIVCIIIMMAFYLYLMMKSLKKINEES